MIVPFLVIASAILYLVPGSTAELFAWTIAPPITAMLLGSAYLGGIWFFGHVVRERRWHRVRHGFPAVVVFASLASIATFLHWDRFHFGHISFIAWVVLYLTTPVLVLVAWLANRSADDRMPEANDYLVPGPLRAAIVVVGVTALLAGAALFVFAESLVGLWAWPLTPLTARIVGAVLILPGIVNLWLIVDARWSAFRLIFQAQLFSLAFIVVAVVIARADLDWTRPVTPAVAAGLVLSLAGYTAFYLYCERQVRPTPG